MTKRATFVDRIAAAVPSGKIGLSLDAALGIVGGPVPYGRKAFEHVAAQGLAQLVRRGRGGAMFLVRLDAGVMACVMCHREFERKSTSKRVTCSKRCQCAMGWQDPVKAAKRRASIAVAAKRPERLAVTAAHNKRRWSKPGEREKLADQNRREWKDEEKAAVRAAKIRINHQRPEMREFYSELRKAHWKDPVKRKKMHDAASASQKVQSYRQQLSELAKARWADPVWRKKWAKGHKARMKAGQAKKMLKAKAAKKEQVAA